MLTADRCYDRDPDFSNYYQGDILSDIPFLTLPTLQPAARQDAWGILRPRPRNPSDQRPVDEIMRVFPVQLIGRAAKDWPDAWARANTSGEYVIAYCKKMTVMLVSRSCDVDKESRKNFLVAPVVPIRELPEPQRTEDKLRDLKANEIFHWFYLPEAPRLPESFADLSQIIPIHRTFFDEASRRQHLAARLSSEGTHAFQSALSNFYGTQFGFVPPDTCPQTARYACSACFHSGRTEPFSREVRQGEIFGDCGMCREHALWVKMPEELRAK